jgi:hypothetical protein
VARNFDFFDEAEYRMKERLGSKHYQAFKRPEKPVQQLVSSGVNIR